MRDSQWSREPKIVIGFSTATGILLYGGFGFLGLVLGYFIPQIVTFALKFPWVPFEGPMRLIHSIDGSWVGIALTLLGLLAGLAVANISIRETLIITITGKEVQLDKDGHTQTIERKDVQTIFLDGKQLVILGESGYELARGTIDESPVKVKGGFEQYRYPEVTEGDPYMDLYRRWIPDDPAISSSANAVMRAREKALKEKNKEEIADLRNELAKMGYVVRDEKTRQYWRQVPNA